MFLKVALSGLMLFQMHSLYCLTLSQMNEAEQKACGIEKLTSDEKSALDGWLGKQIPVQKPAAQPTLQKNKLLHGEFAITNTSDLGRYITLDNGITYEVPSRSRKKTMAWKAGDKVRLIEPIRPTNYKLENIAQSQTIGAKIAPQSLTPK